MKFAFFSIAPLFLFFSVIASSPEDQFISITKKYGLSPQTQSFCIALEDQEIVGHRTDATMNPASVTKLFVTLMALDKLGPEYRFETGFYFNEESRELYIAGAKDPFFATENLFLILSRLDELGITNISTLYFDRDFQLNWQSSPKQITATLTKIFNSQKWSRKIKQSFINAKKDVRNYHLPYDVEKANLSVETIKAETPSLTGFHQLVAHYSNPLYRQLKMMNNFSNNFMAESLFQMLGGQNALESYLVQRGVGARNEFRFLTGSGLGKNYVTCNATIRLLETLYADLQKHNMQLEDVMAVAKADNGTLRNRFGGEYFGSVLAKTGTLNAASTLAGYALSEEGIKFFAIFNSGRRLRKAHALQNDVVKSIFTPAPLEDYQGKPYSPMSEIEIR